MGGGCVVVCVGESGGATGGRSTPSLLAPGPSLTSVPVSTGGIDGAGVEGVSVMVSTVDDSADDAGVLTGACDVALDDAAAALLDAVDASVTTAAAGC